MGARFGGGFLKLLSTLAPQFPCAEDYLNNSFAVVLQLPTHDAGSLHSICLGPACKCRKVGPLPMNEEVQV